MNILALETTGFAGSIAVLKEGNVAAEVSLPAGSRSTQLLAVKMKAVLQQTDLLPTDIDLVAAASGPGSFTGLRVGVVSAKVFAWSAKTAIVGVDTLQAIAWNIGTAVADSISEKSERLASIKRVSVAMDCQRGQVIHRTFERTTEDNQSVFLPVTDSKTEDWEEWINNVEEGVWISGPFVAKIESKLQGRLVVPAELRQPTAEMIGRLGLYKFINGQADDMFQLLPQYSRPAAAEEKRLMMAAAEEEKQ